MSEPSLAERCFAEDMAQDELYAAIHKIMGGAPLTECGEPGFVWKASDCWVDPYDGSVEVVTVEPLTREQANKILDLGFGQIYESHNGEGANWTRTSKDQCAPREGERRAQIKSERDHLKAIHPRMLSALDEAREALEGMVSLWGKVGGTDEAYEVEQANKLLMQEPPVLSGHKDVLSALDEAREALREIAVMARMESLADGKTPLSKSLTHSLHKIAEKASAAHGKTLIYQDERSEG